MSSMLRTLRGGPCRPLTYDRPVAFTLNQDTRWARWLPSVDCESPVVLI
jgi:hypothetical protein